MGNLVAKKKVRQRRQKWVEFELNKNDTRYIHAQGYGYDIGEFDENAKINHFIIYVQEDGRVDFSIQYMSKRVDGSWFGFLDDRHSLKDYKFNDKNRSVKLDDEHTVYFTKCGYQKVKLFKSMKHQDF